MAYDPRWTESKYNQPKTTEKDFEQKFKIFKNQILNDPKYKQTLDATCDEKPKHKVCVIYINVTKKPFHAFLNNIDIYFNFLQQIYKLQSESKRQIVLSEGRIDKLTRSYNPTDLFFTFEFQFRLNDDFISNLKKLCYLLFVEFNIPIFACYNNNAQDSMTCLISFNCRGKISSEQYFEKFLTLFSYGDEKQEKKIEKVQTKAVDITQNHLRRITEENVSDLFQNGCFLRFQDGQLQRRVFDKTFTLEVCGPTKEAVATTGNLLNAIIGYTKDEYNPLLQRLPISMDVIKSKITPHIASEEIKIHKDFVSSEVLNLPDFIRKIDFLVKLQELKQKLNSSDNSFGFRNKTSRKRKSRKNKPSTKSRKSKKIKKSNKSSRKGRKKSISKRQKRINFKIRDQSFTLDGKGNNILYPDGKKAGHVFSNSKGLYFTYKGERLYLPRNIAKKHLSDELKNERKAKREAISGVKSKKANKIARKSRKM